MVGKGHTADIWKPLTPGLTDDQGLKTATYDLAYKGVTCRFNEMNSRTQMELSVSLDTTQDLQIFVSKDERVEELDQYWMIYFREEETFWIIDTPVKHTTIPNFYWLAYVRQIKAISETMEAYYDL